jgi:hypothetical protein
MLLLLLQLLVCRSSFDGCLAKAWHVHTPKEKPRSSSLHVVSSKHTEKRETKDFELSRSKKKKVPSDHWSEER